MPPNYNAGLHKEMALVECRVAYSTDQPEQETKKPKDDFCEK